MREPSPEQPFQVIEQGGAQRGVRRAAAMATLITTAKLNDVDVLARIAATPQTRLHELLPWNWNAAVNALKAA